MPPSARRASASPRKMRAPRRMPARAPAYQASWRRRPNQASSTHSRLPRRSASRRTRDGEAADLGADVAQAGRRAGATVERVVLGGDQAGAVGPAELLAEEAALGGAVAVAGDGVLGIGHAQRAALAEAQAQLDVLGAGHAGLEGADGLEDLAAVGGVGGDRVGRVGADGVALPLAEHADGLALGDGGGRQVAQLPGDAADLGVLEGAGELAQPGGVGEAVAVDEGEDVSPALGDAAVAGEGDAALRLAEQTHRVARDDLRRGVGGAVVDDQDLVAVGRVVAGEDRLDAVADHVRAVADRHHYRDERRVALSGLVRWSRRRHVRLTLAARVTSTSPPPSASATSSASR